MQLPKRIKKGKQSANLFVVNIVVIYLLWKAFAYMVKHTNGWIHEIWLGIVCYLGEAYAAVTSFILNMFWENTVRLGISVFFPLFNKLIRVEDHCLAIPATVIFVGSILSFTGSWRNKIWFVPMGVLMIVIINIIRLVLLCYIFAHFSKSFYEINHSLVYVVITYTLIFLLIVWWMKKFAVENKNNDIKVL
jgi:exosortase/archaeosortase family protein